MLIFTWTYLDFLLILKPSLADDHILDPPPVSKPLLKHCVVLKELLCLVFRDSVQCILIDDSNAFKLRSKGEELRQYT